MFRRHDYEAERVYRDRAAVDPAQPQPHARLAAWLSRAGRLAQAREALQAGLAHAGRTDGLHHLLGLTLGAAGDHAAAERHLVRAAEQRPAHFEYLRDLGFLRGAAGRLGESVATLRRALALSAEGERRFGWLVRLGERALAERGVKRAGEVRQPRRPPRPRGRAAVIERIVAQDPEVAEALVAGADLEPQTAETLRAARRALQRLVAENPTYPDLHFGLSVVAEQLGDIDRAIHEAEQALHLNPRYAEACLLAVRLYEKTGLTEKATRHCRTVTRMRPGWIDAHLRLGRLLREQGRTGEAAGAYRRALEVDAGCREARQHLETLEAALVGEGGDA